MAVAQRMYARALFEAARDQGKLEVVHQELGDFVAAVVNVPELRNVLENPELDPTAKSAVLEEILGDADELVRNFLRLVVEKGREAEIEDIYRELDALVAAEQKRLNVELTTAFELSDEEARLHPEEDRGRLGPQRRGNPQGRPPADRRRRPPGRLAARGRKRARPPEPPPPRTLRPGPNDEELRT